MRGETSSLLNNALLGHQFGFDLRCHHCEVAWRDAAVGQRCVAGTEKARQAQAALERRREQGREAATR